MLTAPTSRSHANERSAWIPCASGGAASASMAWTVWRLASIRAAARFAAGVLAEVKTLACELPAGSDTPLARWPCSRRDTSFFGAV